MREHNLIRNRLVSSRRLAIWVKSSGAVKDRLCSSAKLALFPASAATPRIFGMTAGSEKPAINGLAFI